MDEDRLPIFSTYGLQWCLKELDKDEFQTFKELLKEKYSELTICALPRTTVDSAGAELLASLLHEHYVGPLAWAISINIFEDMNLLTVSEKARDEMKKYALSKISEDSEPIMTYQGPREEDMPETSQAVEQDSAATEMYGRGDGDGEDYRVHVMAKFAKTMDEHHSSEGTADWPEMQTLLGAFNPDQQGFRPHTVVLHGKPGTGKSALARRVVLCWAQGELRDLFSFVFLLSTREIKWTEKSSFVALISREWPGSQARVMEILSQPERLLFVVDSLDNLDFILQDDSGRLCGDWAEEQPVFVLLRCLLMKVLLPRSSLLITISDANIEKLSSVLVCPYYLLVRGMSVLKRAQFLLEHVTDGHRRVQVLRSVMDSRLLFDQCQDTMVCSLIGEALRLEEELGKSVALCQTLTGLYATFFFHQLTPRDPSRRCLNQEERAALKGLCQMAAKGLWNRQSVFHDSTLQVHRLKESDLSALFHMNILLRDEGHGESAYTFLHPSLQQFCAALYYILVGPEEQSSCFLIKNNSWSLTEHQQIGCSRSLLCTKRFLFGLMSPDAMRALEALLGHPFPPVMRQRLLSWVSLLGQQAATALPMDILDSFYCLFETQDAEFVRVALNSLREVWLPVTQSMDLMVSSFCLQHCRHLRKVRVDIRDLFSRDVLAEAWPAAPHGLRQKALVNEWWERFCSVLSSHPNLQQLDLGTSVLNEWAMKSLCIKLRQPTCKIQNLIFKKADVTPGLHYLWMALISNCNIKYLNLGSTPLRDCDVKVACEALRHPHCLLETLRLNSCGLTSASYLMISQILNTSTSLKSLGLAGNQATEEGMKPLCKALNASQCALRELILDNCGLTAVGCRNLASALNSNQSLTRLCLSNNHMGSDGVRLLCRSIRLPDSHLQSLILNQCSLDVASCGFLGFALMNSKRLLHLSLSGNPFGDEGMKLLCEAMRDPSCCLQDLEVVNCHLTSGCCKNLFGVIARNTHLRSLDLAANALGNSGVTVLCDGLKKESSALRRLGLEACGLTSDSCEALSSALSCHQHLASLNLVRNDFSPEGIMKLCSAFTQPTCNLQIIGLWKQQYPAQIRKQLEEVQLLKPYLVIDGSWYSLNEDGRFWWKN